MHFSPMPMVKAELTLHPFAARCWLLLLHQTADMVGRMLDATTPASSAAYTWREPAADTGPASKENALDSSYEIVIP